MNFNFKLNKKIKNVVFIGGSTVFNSLKIINKKNKLNTFIISDPDQKKKLKLDSSIKTFKKVDYAFQKYINKIVNTNETIFISLGARFIFKDKDIKDIFHNRLINFHGSRLPFDAGGGGHTWRILRNDRIDNQLVHLINSGIDTGAILEYSTSLIPKECILPIEIEKFRLKKFLIFYEKIIKKIINNSNFSITSQPSYLSRYNPRVYTKINGWIDWSLSSLNLSRFINSFDDPYDGAMTYINEQKVHIKKVQLHGGDTPNHPFMSGIISRHDGDWITVCTSDQNMILVESVIDLKEKNILKNLRVGDRFITPSKYLDSSKKRVKFTSRGISKKN
jgi:methionyl-tRNA formyltransferase